MASSLTQTSQSRSIGVRVSREIETEPAPWNLLDSPHSLLFLYGLHALLGYVLYRLPFFATVHAGFTLVFAIWAALAGRRSVVVGYVMAYIVGAEVLWRMAKAAMPYEGGK